jgi:hypothetical protein
VRNVAFSSSKLTTSSKDAVVGLGKDSPVGNRLISVKEPLETCLEFVNGGTIGVERIGDVIGLAAFGVAAVFVGGMVKLILFLLGEWVGLGDPSNLEGLNNWDEALFLSGGVGLGIDSFDNRSTRVSFAKPREEGS